MRKVFISSTTVDLPEYRKATIDICQRVGLRPIAMEDFGPDPRTAVAVCFSKVDQADFYLGIYAYRYGWVPPSSEVSITEMEYDRALDRELPVYLYVADPDHPWKPSMVDVGENGEKLKRFKERIGDRHVFRRFRDASSFSLDLLHDLHRLVVSQPAEEIGGHRQRSSMPAPPAMHSVPPYVSGHSFVGRAQELDELDAWGRSDGTVRVIEAIGGMGKSALAWEWARTRAARAIADLAGIVWWSFDESGASTVSFVREALAYILGEAEMSRLDLDPEDRAGRLLAELRGRPYLLVLDGFERVLSAYYQHDPSKKRRDEDVEVALRGCTTPRDGDFLRRLVACAPSKVLISSRLMPRELENRARQPIPGASRQELRGLAPADAVRLLRGQGIRGTPSLFREFLGQFDNHSLLIAVVAGLVRDYRPAPGDFDRWLADAHERGGLHLAKLDLTARHTHIFAFAYGALAPEVKRLLNRMAIFGDAIDYTTLSILDPYASQDAETPGKEKDSPLPDADPPEARDAVTQFHEALGELEDRGLLQWHRETGMYELHPVVRGYALDLLEEHDRIMTCDRIRRYLEGLPPEDLSEATEVGHLRRALMIYRALVGAGRRVEAIDLLRDGLSYALLISIASFPTVLELMKPLFPEGFHSLPALSTKQDQSYVMNDVAVALSELGRDEEALPIIRLTLKIDIDERDWWSLSRALRNYCAVLWRLRRSSELHRVNRLAHNLAVASANAAEANVFTLDAAAYHGWRGQWEEARKALDAFDEDVVLPMQLYRPGDFEKVRCQLGYLLGELQREEVSAALGVSEGGKNIAAQETLLCLRAELALGMGDAAAAFDDAERAMALARRSGSPLSLRQGLMARILARNGRTLEARALIDDALESSRQWSPIYRPDCAAAEVFLETGERERASELALEAFELAWGDGPPFSCWDELERARAALAELGVPEPELAPFDPERVEPIPFEVEIRKVIEELEAKTSLSPQGDIGRLG